MIGLRRDGHASDLGLELVDLGEASDVLATHCAHCAECAARLAAIRLEDAPSRSFPRWLVGVLAVAAALLVVVATVRLPTSGSTDGFRPKGAAVELQLWRDNVDDIERLFDGDDAWVGDHIGFRAAVDDDGYFMIVGRDQRGNPWQYLPEDGAAMWMRATDGFEDLEHAVELDEVLGTERFVAVVCTEPFTFEAVRPSLAGPVTDHDWLSPLIEGCSQSEVRLLKASP